MDTSGSVRGKMYAVARHYTYFLYTAEAISRGTVNKHVETYDALGKFLRITDSSPGEVRFEQKRKCIALGVNGETRNIDRKSTSRSIHCSPISNK